MPLSHFKSLKALGARMRWDTQNIRTSSDNLARSGVPGQKGKKLEKFDFKQVLGTSETRQAGRLATTQAGHMTTSSAAAPYQTKQARDRQNDVAVHKNDIDPHTEMMAINESTTQFQQSSSLYKKITQSYKNFLSVGK